MGFKIEACKVLSSFVHKNFICAIEVVSFSASDLYRKTQDL